MSAFFVLTACNSNKNSDERVLVVSIEPQRSLLEEIVGDKYEVVTILTPGANPETFEPGLQARRLIDKAAIYFTTGFLPFEESITRSLPSDVDIINTSDGITPIYGTHEHNHDTHSKNETHQHGDAEAEIYKQADPHIWTSVKNAKVIVRNMFDEIREVDPVNEAYYKERYDRLDSRLDSLDQTFAKRLSDNKVNRSFAIWHPSLSYLSRDYDLEQISVGYENKEMPVAVLKKVIEEAKADSVRVLFFQKEFDCRQAETLNKELGTEMITINPLDYEWEQQLENIVSALCR